MLKPFSILIVIISFLMGMASAKDPEINPSSAEAEAEVDQFLGDHEDLNSPSLNYQDQNYVSEQANDLTLPISPTKSNLLDKYLAVLKVGSLLTSLDTNAQSVNNQEIIVSAREMELGGQQAFIYNHKGQRKYQTLSKNLVKLDNVLNIFPENKISSGQNSRFNFKDKTLMASIEATLSRENLDITPMIVNQNVSDELSADVDFFEFILGLRLNTSIPVSPGLFIGAQQGSTNNGVGTWNSVLWGIKFDWNWYQFETVKISSSLGACQSLYNQLTLFSTSNSEHLDFYKGFISVKAEFDLPFGQAYIQGGIGKYLYSLDPTNGGQLQRTGENSRILTSQFFGLGLTYDMAL